MLGRTHKKIGIAASFAILQPTTVPACLGALAAGSIGGFICDIDILFRNHSAKDEEVDRDDHYDGEWEDFVSILILFFLYVLVDGYFGGGAVEWFLNHVGLQTMVAGAILALIIACGMIAPHRSYMHSVVVGIALSGCLLVICAPIVPAFAIGYASHIILDLFNKSGIRLFWPARKRFMFNLCASNKTANAIIEAVGEVTTDLLVSYFLFLALLNHNQSTRIFEILNAPFSEGITNLGAWLIFINIITFFVEKANFTMWLEGKGPYQKHDECFNREKDDATSSFIQGNVYILFVLGGALGGLLGYILIAFRGKHYIKDGMLGFAIPAFGAICVVIEWVCIYTAIVRPSIITTLARDNLRGFNAIYLIIYLLAMNLLTYIVYSVDRGKTNQLSVKTLLELLMAFVGGSAGGYLSICLKGYLSAQKPLRSTIKKMLQTHCLMITIVTVLLTSRLY